MSVHLLVGFRPATLVAYQRMFTDFMGLLILADLWLPQVSPSDVLAFMEFLLQVSCSASNITNYLIAIKSMCIVYGCDTTPLRDRRILLFIKSLQINRPLQFVLNVVIDHILLKRIMMACCSFPHPLIFQALYSFRVFSFLRLSNIRPHFLAKFQTLRNLCVVNIVFLDNAAVVIFKWTKMRQDRQQIDNIPIPRLGNAYIYSIKALNLMLSHIPHIRDEPLFQIPTQLNCPTQ